MQEGLQGGVSLSGLPRRRGCRAGLGCPRQACPAGGTAGQGAPDRSALQEGVQGGVGVSPDRPAPQEGLQGGVSPSGLPCRRDCRAGCSLTGLPRRRDCRTGHQTGTVIAGH